MRHTISYIKRALSRFWRPDAKYDHLEASYMLMADDIATEVNDEELARLTAIRDRLRRNKKAYMPVQREIEVHKERIILREMRAE